MTAGIIACMKDFCWLALEASTDVLSIALGRAGQVWSHESPGGAHASREGLATVQALLAQAGIPLAEVRAIAFGRGPGAFTGLRTACAMAQGLAWGANVPVLPIDTLAVLAESTQSLQTPAPHHVLAVLDARMQQVYAAAYTRGADGVWQAQAPVQVVSPEALVPPAHWQGQAWCLAGNADAAYGLAERLHPPVSLHTPPRAEALLRLAPAAWAAGLAVPAEAALPLYVRDKVALTTAERQAAAAGGA